MIERIYKVKSWYFEKAIHFSKSLGGCFLCFIQVYSCYLQEVWSDRHYLAIHRSRKHINWLTEKNHMFIPIKAEKTFHKLQLYFWLKYTQGKLGIHQGNILPWQRLYANVRTFTVGKHLCVALSRLGTPKECSARPLVLIAYWHLGQGWVEEGLEGK